MQEDEELLTVQEAAKWLGVGDTAIRNAMRRGALPFVFKYGRNLIELGQLKAYKARAHPEGSIGPGRPPRAPAQQQGEN